MGDVRDLLRWDGALSAPDATLPSLTKATAARDLDRIAPELAELQEKLFASGKVGDRRSVVLLLQGMDASGKDGTVKHVVGLVNPAGCRITSFGAPTTDELAHDFLWRITNALPPPGHLGVFNRSHYEDVLIVRVHELVPRSVWSRRYARINAWERRLAKQGTTLIKCFLHLSADEQKARLLARVDDPAKHWKVSANDLTERTRWDDYAAAYRAVLDRTSTDTAPWYVVPADRKWARNHAVGHLLLETLRDLDLDWPVPAGIDLAAMRRDLLAS